MNCRCNNVVSRDIGLRIVSFSLQVHYVFTAGRARERVIKSVRFSMSAWVQQEAGPTSSAEAKKSEPKGQEKKCCKCTHFHITQIKMMLGIPI